MRLQKTWLQVNPKSREPKIEVLVISQYIDSFGKDVIFKGIFEEFTLKKQVYDNLERLRNEGKNCLANFDGFKL